MSEQYKFDDHDRRVVEALKTLLWKLMTAKVLPPAKLISVAKVLHVLWHLPRPTKYVSVTINIGYRVEQQEGISGGSSLTLSVEPELLNLDCAESSYEAGFGSEAWTTMSFRSARFRSKTTIMICCRTIRAKAGKSKFLSGLTDRQQLRGD